MQQFTSLETTINEDEDSTDIEEDSTDIEDN